MMHTSQDNRPAAAQVETQPAKPASHDTAPPPALVEFMMKEWRPALAKPPSLVRNSEVHQARRRELSQLFPGETLLVPTGHEKIRSNDTVYRFRPGSDFYYLTGNKEPDCILVLSPKEGGGHRDLLFVEPNPGRTDATFFTDRAKGELWVGPRLGVEQSRQRYGVDECRGLPELEAFVGSLRGETTRPWRTLRGISPKLDAMLPEQEERDRQLGTALSERRLLKGPLEVRELGTSIAATFRAFEDVIQALKRGSTERHLEGTFASRARVEGNDVGYGTIAASGAHACILHWTRNDGKLRAGDLVLLDAGVEGHSLYTADVTRTLPVSGKFSPAQREVYSLVLEAQLAAMEAVKPGNDFLEPNRRAMKVLAEGLERMGILPSAEEALKEEHQFYKRYTLHNVSHMLGLDVHDCARARQENYKQGKLKTGMVLTAEPGLYFQLDDRTVPPRYRGIGVRIEDDVLVTQTGYRNLTKAFPKEPEAVEAWMARVWKRARR
ncbi:MAG: aminopeptidase P family protein [Myxococcales bacterium]|nr:aminopeptidase P family protein [Myxococcales bacterium]